MCNAKIRLYEELSQNAHPALQTQFYDGWVLRYSKGHRENRINSVNPLYPSSLGLGMKIDECEKRYAAQGQPAVFKLTEATDPDFDAELEKRGYAIVTPTYVMEMDMRNREIKIGVNNAPAAAPAAVIAAFAVADTGDSIIASHADDEWLNAYFTLNKHTDRSKINVPARIFDNIKNIAAYGRIVKDGVSVACGSMVIENGYMGLLNIVVDESRRRQGYGMALCMSLLAEAKRLGAHTAYLQVVRDNRNAVSLYKKIGYKTVYKYWYRIKKIGV
jgi:ribosomal protein S18 acetylase RimI-like enzyme